jgi:signal transduction histidine kinase
VEVVAYAPLFWIPGTCGVVCNLGWSPLFVFSAIGGTAVYYGRRLHAELGQQNELLRRTREQRVRLAVTEERTRVARDLHDMVAHGLTVMVVQAGAARALMGTNMAGAREALDAVRRAGHDALEELNSLMGSLGAKSGDDVPGPVKGQSIRSLVAHAASAEILIELSIENRPESPDPGLEVSMYRIVQEALTNMAKHAPGARGRVAIRYTSEGVEVDVTNTRPRATAAEPSVPGTGQGLIGIAERAALFGGDAEAGPTPNGGFRVWARLPSEPVPA